MTLHEPRISTIVLGDLGSILQRKTASVDDMWSIEL